MGLPLLGGVAVGAALMYLFDPETGSGRRAELHKTANDALSKAGASLGTAGSVAADGLHDASSHAGSLWSTLSEKARDLASTIGHHAQTAASSTGEGSASAYETARDTARGWASRARSGASNAYDGAREQLGYEEQHSYTAPIAIGASTAALLGAAAIYFLDSEKGAGRRRQVTEAVNRVVRQTSDMARTAGQRFGATAGQQSPAGEQLPFASSDQYVDENYDAGQVEAPTTTPVSFNPQGT